MAIMSPFQGEDAGSIPVTCSKIWLSDFWPAISWAAHSAAHQKVGVLPESQILERVTGVEPVLSDWQPDVMPLYDTRNLRLLNTKH